MPSSRLILLALSAPLLLAAAPPTPCIGQGQTAVIACPGVPGAGPPSATLNDPGSDALHALDTPEALPSVPLRQSD